MKKRIINLIMILALILAFGSQVFASNTQSLNNFTKINTYIEGQFSDVSSDSWFSSNVATAYELGMMKGSSNTFFNPSDKVTIAEAITIAARLHSIYFYGTDEFKEASPWYKVYVDYSITNGIITSPYSNYDKVATRAEFATILAGAFPPIALKSINTIEDGAIPDLPMSSSYPNSIYMLYRAGILKGNDPSGTLTPDATIERSAAAAIVTRMTDPTLRKKFTLKIKKHFPLEIVGVSMKTDIIGTAMINVVVKNTGNVAIDAFEFYSLVYDAYDDPIYYFDNGTNEFIGTWSKPTSKALAAGSQLGKDIYWTYYGFEGVKKIKIALRKAHTVDGKTYEVNEDKYIWTSWKW